MNYNHLRYFWAVAHDGNLTRTAERLHLSQSALSVQIRKLEGSLGHALFERRGRQLILTEAGRIALDHADTIFSTGDELMGALRQSGAGRMVLRVGALATLSRNFQINFLRSILGRKDVNVILRSGSPADLLGGLEALNLDLVLTNRPPTRDAVTPFVSRRLNEQSVSLVGVPSRITPDATIADLLTTHPVIVPTGDSHVRIGFDALAERLKIRPTIVAEADDMAMLRLLAREGIGLVVLPRIVVQDELESGLLIEAHRLPEIIESFYAVFIERQFPNPLLQDLLAQ